MTIKANKFISLPSLNSIHTIIFDFDGVFTDNKVYVSQDGTESVCCDRRDGLAIDFLRKFKQAGKLKADIFILSTETNPIVETRAKKLKLPCFSGVKGKLSFIEAYFDKNKKEEINPFQGLIYLGNDLNDLQAIQKAGCSIVPSDAHPMIQSVATYVLEQAGGQSFVRAFVELFLGVNSFNNGEINELVFNS